MNGRETLLGRRALRPLWLQLLRLHRAALRRPRRTLLVAGALLLAAAAELPRARLHLALRDMVEGSAELPAGERDRRAEAEFGAEHAVLVVLSPRAPGGFSADELTAIRSWIDHERRTDPALRRASSPFDVLRAERRSGDGRLRLVPALATPDPEALRALAATAWGGILTDRSGRDVAVELVYRDAAAPGRFGRFDPRVIAAMLARCRAQVLDGHPGVALHLGGAAAFDHHALAGFRRFQALNGAVLVVLVVLMRLLLGRWRGGLLLAGVVALSGVLVYGAMAAAGAPLDLLGSGLLLVLAVAAIEDFFFVSHAQLSRGEGWRRAFRRLLLPGFLTSLTTAVGFASLCAADLAMVRRFGAWGAAGAVVEWCGTFLVLPALLRVAPGLRVWTCARRAVARRGPDRWARLRLPGPAAWGALLVVPAAVVAALHLGYDDSPEALFDRDHPFREALAYLEATRGWVGELEVVLPEDVSFAEIAALSRDLAGQPGVARVLDPAAVLREWTGGDPLAVYELAAEGAGAAAPGTLRSAGGRLRAVVFVRDGHLSTLLPLRDRIASRFPSGDGFPAGALMDFADFGATVPATLFRSLLTCLGLTGLVVVLLFRALGLPGALRALLASLVGPAVALLLLWASGVPVNALTAVFASVLVGLTGDNAVQFACAAHGRSLSRGIGERGGAALLLAGAMAVCALVLLGSIFVPPRQLGLLLAAGLVAAAAGDVFVLRGLLGPGGAARRGAGRRSPQLHDRNSSIFPRPVRNGPTLDSACGSRSSPRRARSTATAAGSSGVPSDTRRSP